MEDAFPKQPILRPCSFPKDSHHDFDYLVPATFAVVHANCSEREESAEAISANRALKEAVKGMKQLFTSKLR